MQKNKTIITCAGNVLVVVGFILAVCSCQLNGNIGFVHYENPETGDQLGTLYSLFVYLFLWIVSGVVPSAVVILLKMAVYYFLHRADKRLFERGYHPEYEQECDGIVESSLRATYSAMAVLFLLYIFGFVIFP